MIIAMLVITGCCWRIVDAAEPMIVVMPGATGYYKQIMEVLRRKKGCGCDFKYAEEDRVKEKKL